jgi:hypothetical protein
MDIELKKRKQTYLKEHVFHGLTNLNTGFDVPSIYYFSEVDFHFVLERVQALGLGIPGIEPWLAGEFFDVACNNEDCFDPKWYWACFEKFKSLNLPLQYAASFDVPEEKLQTAPSEN